MSMCWRNPRSDIARDERLAGNFSWDEGHVKTRALVQWGDVDDRSYQLRFVDDTVIMFGE